MLILYSRSTRIIDNPDNYSKDSVDFFHQNQDLTPEIPQFNQYTTKMISLLVSFRSFPLSAQELSTLHVPLWPFMHTHTSITGKTM